MSDDLSDWVPRSRSRVIWQEPPPTGIPQNPNISEQSDTWEARPRSRAIREELPSTSGRLNPNISDDSETWEVRPRASAIREESTIVGRPHSMALTTTIESSEPYGRPRSRGFVEPREIYVPTPVPSGQYRRYTQVRQLQNILEPIYSFDAYDPLFVQRGPHQRYGQPIPGTERLFTASGKPIAGTELRQYPDPTFSQLGQSQTGYTFQHPSEEYLEREPELGRRAVYDTYEGAPVQGVANWPYYYGDWAQVGEQYKEDIPRDQPLSDNELKFTEKYGFHFERQLGRGSYGAVWFVRATNLFKDDRGNYYERNVACKVLSLPKFKTPTDSVELATKKLLREAELHQSLEHPNIVKCERMFHIHDEKTGFPFCRSLMFMELCSGDLKSLIESQPLKHFDERQTFDVLNQMSDALNYIHDQNICHLDIKIHNVLYINDKNHFVYKLADFGISKKYGAGTVPKQFGAVGTRLYMAPEAASIPKKMSESKPIDIYCLGLLIAECLSGRARFKRLLIDIQNWSAQVQQTWGVSEVCADLLIRMTETDPKQRPTIQQVRQHPWFQIM